MGEQRPMSTIRGFVHAVWSVDFGLTPPWKRNRTSEAENPADPPETNKSWIIPDTRRTTSHELRRITTPYDIHGRRTDFYELYWADITQGNTRERLMSWVMELLWRKRSDIPANAFGLYVATWIIFLIVILSAGALALLAWFKTIGPVLVVAITIVASIIFWVIDKFALPYFGDVASYVRAAASTVEKRALVRQRGLSLLKPLMEDAEYDRVVLVSHSLGSIIAYDLLQILWAEYGPHNLRWPEEKVAIRAMHAIGKYVAPANPAEAGPALDEQERSTFRALQWQLYTLLRQPVRPGAKCWKISDFVTLGSPLTHAEFLMTHNRAEFRRGIEERLFSTCPPISDKPSKRTIIYLDGKRGRHAHHAAVFAATRWTNIFDTGNLWSTGDPISGSMEEIFGQGVENRQVRLTTRLLGLWTRIFTHTCYWSMDVGVPETPPPKGKAPPHHIQVLREAIDLGRKLEPKV